jgi:hypothetical protein
LRECPSQLFVVDEAFDVAAAGLPQMYIQGSRICDAISFVSGGLESIAMISETLVNKPLVSKTLGL